MTTDDLEAIEALIEYAEARQTPGLEELLTSAEYFGLTTASPLQRAVCRVIDGSDLAELAKHPHVVAAIGDVGRGIRPAEAAILSGIRTAKSLLAAALAVHASQTCDVSRIGKGETPRVAVVSVTVDLARVVFEHLLGNVLAKPRLNRLLVCEPTADTITLWHPSGMPIEVKVVAGTRAGASLVARWMAGVIFDEATRMVGSGEGVVNLNDMRAAVLGRLLPGAQVLYIGSPWAPFGPVWDMVQQHFQKPSRKMVVIKAPAYRMNPVWWTEERCERLRIEDPEVYNTDVEAEFHAPAASLFALPLLDAAVRAEDVVPPAWGYHYEAAMDPATRGNAWTLVIATREGERKRVVLAKQWQGSRVTPLSPRRVLTEIALLLRDYRITVADTDQFAGDALRDLASDLQDEQGKDVSFYLAVREWNEGNKRDVFLRLKTEMELGRIELPPDKYVRADLLGVRKNVTQNGVSIGFTRTPDGRHCDYAPAIALVMSRYFEDNQPQPPPKGTPEHAEWLDAQEAARQDDELSHQQAKPWWSR